MEIVSPLLDIFSRLYTCCAKSTNYVRKLKENLITLETSFETLKCKRDDVNTRIEREEGNPAEPAKRTSVVSDWLKRVQDIEVEVQKILNENDDIKNGAGGCYFGCWGRKNCWSAYRLGKLVWRKQTDVQRLSAEGDFQDVTYICQPDLCQQIPMAAVVGMSAKFNEVLESLITKEDPAHIVGLYGMGGVGKTTLLQKLNNELAKRKHFDLVIFVVVSKDLNLKSIQNQIGEKLGISWKEETTTNEKANNIFKVLQDKKFLLLLDDIWKGFKLETIGVSKVTFEKTGSKVVFSTRENKVCGAMGADKRIQVECLDEDQAWILFQQKVQQEALNSHPDVPEVARKVAKECQGLPLALIAIGCTMSSKMGLQEWQHALHTLHESASQFSGMAEEVLAIMKYSYDNLESQKLKSCFLYCALYPEDFSIQKLDIISLWMGEGFLDNIDDFVKAQNQGLDMIRCLKDACLLETGIVGGAKTEMSVKMHDIVRDLALWIDSDLGRKKGTYLTLEAESTLKLAEWENAERISLIENQAIKELNVVPDCPNLITLLLKKSSISVISDGFFRLMPKLIVLDMEGLEVKKLPASIFSLSELQFLELPEYNEDFVLTPGSFSSLTKLKILALPNSCCQWEVDGGPSLRELESLQHLICLKLTIGTGIALQRLVTSPKLQSCTKYLTMRYCRGITSVTFLPSLPSSPDSLLSLVQMNYLIELILEKCDELEELRIISGDEDTLLTTLEHFNLEFMPKLKIVWDVPPQSFCSVNLKVVSIRGCPQLKDITWLIYAHNLEILYLVELDGLEEIISDGIATNDKLFSRLNLLVLISLRNLERICDPNVKFSHLEKIGVVQCPKLKKLPFNSDSAIPQNLKIRGEMEWLESLEWEDEATESNLLPYCY